MFKFRLTAIALAAGLLAAPSAMADVTFDPSLGLAGHWDVDETTDFLTVNILGAGINPADTGTFYMNEEPPFTTFGSDSITVSNDPVTGFGVIVLNSTDMPRATTTCNDAVDESTTGTFEGGVVPAGHCYLDLRLTTGGLDLFVDIYSPAGDTADPNFSDSIDIRVPEPASMAVLGFGLAALGVARRRRG